MHTLFETTTDDIINLNTLYMKMLNYRHCHIKQVRLCRNMHLLNEFSLVFQCSNLTTCHRYRQSVMLFHPVHIIPLNALDKEACYYI